jgi:hypothetical protein
VRGILFSSRPLKKTDRVPAIADVTASVRALVGGAPVPDAAGTPLF